MPRLFTPFAYEGTRMRAYMVLSDDDFSAFCNLDLESSLEIIDLITGRSFVVKRADCGGGCHCAGVVLRELKEPGAMPGYQEGTPTAKA